MTHCSRVCPHCGAVLEVLRLAPGDEVARCPYCETVVDPSDNETVKAEEQPGSPGGAGPMPDLMSHVNELLGQVRSRAWEARARGRVEPVPDEQVNVGSRTAVGQDRGEMPPEVEDMLAGMGITFGPDEPEAEAEAEPAPLSNQVLIPGADGGHDAAELLEERGDQALVALSDGSRRWIPRTRLVRLRAVPSVSPQENERF